MRYNGLVQADPKQPNTHFALRDLFAGLDAALFDLDNTLVETHIDFPAMKRRLLAFVSDFGLDAERLMAFDILGVVEAAGDELRARRGTGEAAAGDAERFRSEAFALLADIEERECANPVKLSGAAEVLDELRTRGVPVAIVTRNCRRVSKRLCALSWLHHDALLSRDDVTLTKPHPAHLHDALAVLSTRFPGRSIVPAACVMVGDNTMDVQAGHAAGMRTLGLRRGKPASHFTPSLPDVLIEDMGELWERMQREG